MQKRGSAADGRSGGNRMCIKPYPQTGISMETFVLAVLLTAASILMSVVISGKQKVGHHRQNSLEHYL